MVVTALRMHWRARLLARNTHGVQGFQTEISMACKGRPASAYACPVRHCIIKADQAHLKGLHLLSYGLAQRLSEPSWCPPS